MKVWYKNIDPTKIISFGKSVGNADESSFDVDVPATIDTDSYDMEFYETAPGPPKALVRKSQAAIDAIIAARVQSRVDFEAEQAQKKIDINTNLPDWITVGTVADNIANLADAKVFIKKLARVVYWLAKNSAT